MRDAIEDFGLFSVRGLCRFKFKKEILVLRFASTKYVKNLIRNKMKLIKEAQEANDSLQR